MTLRPCTRRVRMTMISFLIGCLHYFLTTANPVEAAWFEEVCNTGPRYKVRLDETTGKVVQVGQLDFFGDGKNSPDKESDHVEPTSLYSVGMEDETNISEDYALGNTETDDELGKNRKLRSKRIWRDLGEPLTDALVVSKTPNDRSSETSYSRRFLEAFQRLDVGSRWLQSNQDRDELKDGEFFLKPCLCKSSRWTFPDEDSSDFFEAMNASNSTNSWAQNPIDHTELIKNPNNYGLDDNGLYYYIPPGWDESSFQNMDLYLCNSKAMYCGVNIDDIDEVSGDLSTRVTCYEQNMRHIIARNAWPLILLWYAGLAIICCCTVHGRTASDYVQDRLCKFVRKFVCCCWEIDYDFNERMLNRMMEEDGLSPRRDNNIRRWWFFSSQRRLFEQSLLAQVQWIWRHQEYLRELERRERGLPPPQIKLKVKKFSMETTTSGSKGGGFLNSTNANTTSKSSTTSKSTGTIPAITYIMKKNDSTTDLKELSSPSSSQHKKEISLEGTNTAPPTEDADVVTLDLGANAEEGENATTNVTGETNERDNALVCQACHDSTDDENDDDSLQVPTCAICFSPFEEGDRIGDLVCRHEFHVDCLKGWVQRKNACPLCNVRLGAPERPQADGAENTQDDMDVSRHSISSLMQRIGNLRRNHSNPPQQETTMGSGGGGEIHRRSRVGMIGSVSAANDIAVASRLR